MAVANQTITTLRPLRLPAAVAGSDARVAPRWLTPLFLVTLDGVAVLGAALVVGVASLLPLLYVVLALASLAAAATQPNQDHTADCGDQTKTDEQRDVAAREGERARGRRGGLHRDAR